MSSFIVEDKTIHRIVSWIANNQHSNWTSTYIPSEWKKCNNFDKLGKSLIALNYKATNARYAEQLKVDIKYKWENLYHINDFQALKSAECLRYQCSEGNVPKTKLFKLLERLIEGIKSNIIRKIKTYEDAEWG